MKKILILSLFLVSCQEVITLDLDEGQTRLVVEARLEQRLESGLTHQEIRLKTTSPYFDNQIAPKATGATVYVEEASNRYDFIESSPGVYTHPNLPISNEKTYDLTVEWKGDSYKADSEVALVPIIDSIYIEKAEATVFDKGGKRVYIDYYDPPAVDNFYYWQQFVNDTLQIEYNPGTKFTKISSDELYDGLPVKKKDVENGFPLEEGDEVLIRQHGLSEEMFNYYSLLFEIVGGEGFFEKPPSEVKSNIQNITSDKRYPLGYFYVSEVSERSVSIPEED